MGLPEPIRDAIINVLKQNVTINSFDEVFRLHSKHKIFKTILHEIYSHNKFKIRGLSYVSDVYRIIRRHKQQLQEAFDAYFPRENCIQESSKVDSGRYVTGSLDPDKEDTTKRDTDKECVTLYRRQDYLIPNPKMSHNDQHKNEESVENKDTNCSFYAFEKNLRDDSHKSSQSEKKDDERLSKPDMCFKGLEDTLLPEVKTAYPYVKHLECTGVLFADRHSFLKHNLFSVGVYCVVVFKGCHRRKTGRYRRVEYALCKHSGCRKFKILYEMYANSLTQIEVRFDKEVPVHESEEHAYQLRGQERAGVKKKLLHSLPNSVRSEDIRDANVEALRSGNWDKIRSLEVYQKARSEAKAAMDMDQNSYLDLVLRSISEPGDQRCVQFPDGETLVYIYTKRQIDVLYAKRARIVAYFDATGSVVRPIKSGTTAYYYALTVNIDGKIVPVAELISSKHDSATLSCFFIHLKRYITVTVRKSWSPFSVIVTDWSFALISGVCLGFNEMTVYRYLITIYNFITNKSQDLSNIIILRTCCSHFIKMIVNKISKIKIQKQSRKIIIEMVSALVVAESFELLGHLFKALVTVLLHSQRDPEVEASIAMFREHHSSADIVFSFEEPVIDDKSYSAFEKERGKYSESPFFLHFLKIYTEVSDNVSGTTTADFNQNQLRSEDFAKYILVQCMPFVPLWTGIMNPVIGREGTRFSNANAECWFKIVKKDILGNERRLKVGRFVEKTKDRIEIILKSLEFEIDLKPRRKRDSSKLAVEADLKMEADKPLKVEKWKLKNEKSSYFSKIKLGKYLKKTIQTDKNSQPPMDQETVEDSQQLSGLSEVIKYSVFEEKYVRQKLAQYVKELTYFDIQGSSEKPSVIESSCLTQTDASHKSEIGLNNLYSFLENGLMFSSSYYLKCHYSLIPKNFVVGFYKYEGHRLKLCSNSYATLISRYNYDLPEEVRNKEKWLSDDCIDSAAYSILGHHPDMFYVDAVASSLLFNKQCDDFNSFKPVEKSLELVNFILIPVNFEQMHWFLLVLDLKSKRTYVFNSNPKLSYSMYKIQDIITYYFGLRNKTHTTITLNIEEWQLSVINFVPHQKDAVNCGVYVLYYIYAVTETKDIRQLDIFFQNNFFDPERFRITLQLLLLLSSDDVSVVCVNCGLLAMNARARCYFCRRYIHTKQCSVVMSVSIHNTKCSLCDGAGNPFDYVKSDASVSLHRLVTEHFVQHYKHVLLSIVESKDTNEESRRYREISDHQKHLKWDYSTAFFDVSSSLDVAKALRRHIKCDVEYICYVLLGIVNRIIFHKYYGLPEHLYDMYSYYRELNGMSYGAAESSTIFEYPSPYTLDKILEMMKSEDDN